MGMLGESPTYAMRLLGDLHITKMLMHSFREQDNYRDKPKYARFWDPAILLQPRLDTWNQSFTTKVLAFLLKEGIHCRSLK